MLRPQARLLAGTVLLAACAAPVEFVDQHADGSKRSVGQLVDGMQEGPWTYYFANGNKKSEGRFKRDVRDGVWTWWYENGQPESTGAFHQEYSTGPWTYWWPNGTVRARGLFDRGRKNGGWEFFGHNGKPEQRGEYAHGKRSLRWEFFYPDGKPKARGWLLDDVKVGDWTYWTADGTESTGQHAMPDGVSLVFETWDGGTPRRAGFRRRGRADGRWVTWHDNGARRFCGDFADGRLTGTCCAFDPEGALLASGPTRDGRPTGTWAVVRDGRPQPTPVDGSRPPAISSGTWMRAAEFRPTDPMVTVERWLQEATSPAENTLDLKPPSPPTQPPRPAPDPEIVRETGVAKQEPERPQGMAWTVRELKKMSAWVESYASGRKSAAFSAYSLNKQARGDRARARRLIGKQLPINTYVAANGTRVDLAKQRQGRWLVMVILRGFAGQVCPYCPPQIKALESIEKELERLKTDLVVIYPGRERGMQAFLTAYRKLGTAMRPPYGMCYDPDCQLARELDIMEKPPSVLVRSTTLILDDNGKVRFAYVAANRADRPAAVELLRTLRRLR